MNELISVMQDILSELQDMNRKLDEIKGSGLYDSIADVCNKLDNIESAINSVETAIDLK